MNVDLKGENRSCFSQLGIIITKTMLSTFSKSNQGENLGKKIRLRHSKKMLDPT